MSVYALCGMYVLYIQYLLDNSNFCEGKPSSGKEKETDFEKTKVSLKIFHNVICRK